MKHIFNIIYSGFRAPRHYVRALSTRWSDLFKAALIAIAMLMVGMFSSYLEPLNQIQNEVSEAMELMPEFEVHDQTLSFNQEGKPFYYTGQYFQLVVDDAITPSDDGQLLVPKDKRSLISNQTLVNLYVLNDRTYAKMGSTIYNVTNVFGTNYSADSLRSTLSMINQPSGWTILALILSLFIVQIPVYFILMCVIAFFSRLFNFILRTRIAFRLRLKIAMVASIVPIIVTQLFQAFIPFNFLSYHLIIIGSLIIIMLAYRDQANYLNKMFNMMSQNGWQFILEEEKDDEEEDEEEE